MNETQYDRAWQHFNVPKLEIQNTTPDEEKKLTDSHTKLSTHSKHTFVL